MYLNPWSVRLYVSLACNLAQLPARHTNVSLQ
uniref:Uncharacterized protein n=1 Tax=Rhizophora mucronata TaxID=61149 RepID=A0A2P2P3M9_RHIMU